MKYTCHLVDCYVKIMFFMVRFILVLIFHHSVSKSLIDGCR